MLTKLPLLLAASILVVCTGCATQVATQVNAFRAPGPLATNVDITVVASNPDQAKSLEFQHYKAKLEQALHKQGYVIASGATATYQASLGYGVERLEARRDSGLRTGIVTSSGSGRRGYGFGTSVMLLDDNGADPVFERKLTIAISENNKEGKRLYEVTGVSEGKCGVLSEVFDDMLAGIFAEFPASDGRLKVIKVPATSQCR